MSSRGAFFGRTDDPRSKKKMVEFQQPGTEQLFSKICSLCSQRRWQRVGRQSTCVGDLICSRWHVTVCAATERGLFVLSQSPRWGPVATEGGCYWDIAKAVFYCHPKEALIKKLIGQILL